MSAEQEQKRARFEVAKLLAGHTQLACLYSNQPSDYLGVVDYLFNNGVTVELPPEPQWTPGQYVMLSVTEEPDQRLLARRNRLNDGWELIGVEPIYRDDEVTDVEPVAVLPVRDVQGIVNCWLGGSPTRHMLERLFAERGVDVR